jgi:Flp pilus assembly pilin Flp
MADAETIVAPGSGEPATGARPCPVLQFRDEQRGATSLEYCFIAFLISIIAIVAMTQIGTQTLANTSSVLIGFAR